MLKWSQIVNDGNYKVFRINDSWNGKEKQPNGHLKSRVPGDFRLTLPLSEPLLQLLKVFQHRQKDFLWEHDLSNYNDLIVLNITDYNSCSLGYPISQRSMNEMLKKICEKVGVENGNLGGKHVYLSPYLCN